MSKADRISELERRNDALFQALAGAVLSFGDVDNLLKGDLPKDARLEARRAGRAAQKVLEAEQDA